MRRDIETYELIEQYLNGHLTGEELKRVEDLINSDAKFAREVEQHQLVSDFIFNRSMIDLKDQIKNIHENSRASSSGKFGREKLYGFIGAIIITGTIVTALLIHKEEKEIHPEQLPETTESKQEPKIVGTSPSIEVEENTPENNAEKPIEKNNVEIKPIPEGVAIERIEEKIEEKSAEPETNEENAEPKDIFTVTESETKVEPVNEITGEAEPHQLNPCQGVSISADISTEKSCNNKASGKIIISENSINGGEPPYQVSIDNGKNFYMQQQFAGLYSKLYSVVIKDKNDCKSSPENMLVESMDCKYEYQFAPDEGENWEIPTQEKNGSIKIYNKAGQVIYRQVFDYPGTFYWNGRTDTERELPMGVYSFILELEGEQPLVGTVTIIR